MIEYFDIYVRFDYGFVAVKGEFVCVCKERCGSYDVAFYRNRQPHKRAIAACLGGNIRWCREHAVKRMKKLIQKSSSSSISSRMPMAK